MFLNPEITTHVPPAAQFTPPPEPLERIPPPKPMVSGRRLSPSQEKQILAALSAFPEQQFTIDCAVNDPEAHRFAGEIRDALIRSHWNMLSYVPAWDMGFSSAIDRPNYFGVQWFISAAAPAPTAGVALGDVLKKCCGIAADGVHWLDPTMQVGTVYIWIGPDNTIPIH
jgi:hypothetical protein